MTRSCRNCQRDFEITASDRAFLERISPAFDGKKYLISEPTLCPDCRSQRRLAFRNERRLYRRHSDLSGQEFISVYAPNNFYRIVTPAEWWSDSYDPMDQGRDFDFSRPFFPQFAELWKAVPLLGLNVLGCENSEYVSYCGYSKNCYLCYNSDYSENLLYCTDSIRCTNSVDLLKCVNCEWCADCVDLHGCHTVKNSQLCWQCQDSELLFDCRGCQQCFGCAGLRNKQYHLWNQPCTSQEYANKIQELKARHTPEELAQRARDIWLQCPRPNLQSRNSEQVSGNYIFDSKNVEQSFDIDQSRDIKYCGTLNTVQDCADWDYTGYNSAYCYELSSYGDRIHQSAFTHNIWSGGSALLYCVLGSALSSCFGCVGLRHKNHCIFNTQYSKAEYENLVPKIIEHMMKTGEWGEFFPMELAPFAYNETIAQEYFPLTKTEAVQKGWKWRETEEGDFSGITKRIPAEKAPRTIQEIPDDILNWAIECAESKRLFKIQKAELDFYRKMNLPIPKFHPDVRHQKRIAMRNPRKLWQRNCMNCQKPIETTYAPERPERVYCEACYLAAVY